MRRVRSTPRDGWAEKVEAHGLAFHRTAHPEHLTRPYWDESVHYVFEMDEVLALEGVVNELHRMCLDVVEHVVSTGRYHALGIPDWVAPLIEESWRRGDPHLYGRFDLRYDGQGQAKLLEYNADTPTALVESSVVQWYWLQDTHPGTTSGTPSTSGSWPAGRRSSPRWTADRPTSPGRPVTRPARRS